MSYSLSRTQDYASSENEDDIDLKDDERRGADVRSPTFAGCLTTADVLLRHRTS